MLLEKLSLYNYGVYGGKNEFELVTTTDKPLIIIGGFNGAGKSTILESIMITLYGKSFFGINKSKKEYLNFIYKKIHRSNKKRSDSAYVEISFRFYHNSSENKYVIKRSWDVTGASVTENLLVKKNDNYLDDVDESQWQSFIEGILPIGIVKLFFLDGEKITEVVKDMKKYHDEIKRSLDTLIGADLVQQLHADLNLYVLRKSGQKGDSLETQYKEGDEERKQLIVEIKELEYEHKNKVSEIVELKKQINLEESQISGIGGGYANMRGELLTQKAVLDEKLRMQEKELYIILDDEMPFYLVRSLLQKVKIGVKKDMEFLEIKYSNNFIKKFTNEMMKRVNSPDFHSDPKVRKDLAKKILEFSISIAKIPDKIIFDLSLYDAQRILDISDKIQKGHDDISQMNDNYTKTTSRIEKFESDIVKIPKDDEIGPRISKINEMHHDLGILNAEIAHINQQIASKKSYFKILQNRLKNMILSIQKIDTASTGMTLASKIQSVLDTYYSNLKERKIQELEINLLDTSRLLLHKESISKIKIDRETFEIKAYEHETDQISGDFLSMGEQQIVATALFWAIARTCGRSLPFVIDTPVSRLDGLHLNNMIERFYPHASHQFILLSTDREIGPKEYKRLAKSISNSYRITCDKKRSVTSITPDYFVEDQIAAI